jgi:hypothetical protein
MVGVARLSCWRGAASTKNIPLRAPSAVQSFAVGEFGSGRWRSDGRLLQINLLRLILIDDFVRREPQEKCVAAEHDLAINPSPWSRCAALSLLFLQSTRHPSQAAPSS